MPWRLGIGVGIMRSLFAGAGQKTTAFPNLSYENDRVRIAGLRGDIKLGTSAPFSFAVRAKYELGDGYKSGDEGCNSLAVAARCQDRQTGRSPHPS